MQAVQIMDICGSSGAFELDENIRDTVTAICLSGHLSLLKTLVFTSDFGKENTSLADLSTIEHNSSV